MTKNDSFYDELQQVFDQFIKYDIKILSGDFGTELWTEGA